MSTFTQRFLSGFVMVFLVAVNLPAVETPALPSFDRKPGVFRVYNIVEDYERQGEELVLTRRRARSVLEYDESGRVVIWSGDWGREPYALGIYQNWYTYDDQDRVIFVERKGHQDAVTAIRYVESAEEIPEYISKRPEDTEIQWFDLDGRPLRTSWYGPGIGREKERTLYFYEEGRLSSIEEYWRSRLSGTYLFEYGTNPSTTTERRFDGDGSPSRSMISEWDNEGRLVRRVWFDESGEIDTGFVNRYAEDGTYLQRPFRSREEIDEYLNPDGTLRERDGDPWYVGFVSPYPVDRPHEHDVDLGYPTTSAVAQDRVFAETGEPVVTSRILQFSFDVPTTAEWVPVGEVRFNVRGEEVIEYEEYGLGDVRIKSITVPDVETEVLTIEVYRPDGEVPDVDMDRLQTQLDSYITPDYTGSPAQLWALERFVESELLAQVPPTVFIAVRR